MKTDTDIAIEFLKNLVNNYCNPDDLFENEIVKCRGIQDKVITLLQQGEKYKEALEHIQQNIFL